MAATLTSSGITFSDGTSKSTNGSSAATVGYQKMANGLILQWGSSGTAVGLFNFAIAFPNACLAATATFSAAASGGGACNATLILGVSTTQVNIGYTDVASASVNGVNWIAVGY